MILIVQYWLSINLLLIKNNHPTTKKTILKQKSSARKVIFSKSNKTFTHLFIKVLLCTSFHVTLSRYRRSLSYRHQPIHLQSKSLEWFLYDSDCRLERVKILHEMLGKDILLFFLIYSLFAMHQLFNPNLGGLLRAPFWSAVGRNYPRSKTR